MNLLKLLVVIAILLTMAENIMITIEYNQASMTYGYNLLELTTWTHLFYFILSQQCKSQSIHFKLQGTLSVTVDYKHSQFLLLALWTII